MKNSTTKLKGCYHRSPKLLLVFSFNWKWVAQDFQSKATIYSVLKIKVLFERWSASSTGVRQALELIKILSVGKVWSCTAFTCIPQFRFLVTFTWKIVSDSPHALRHSFNTTFFVCQKHLSFYFSARRA